MKPLKVLGASIHGSYGTASAVAGLFAFFGWALVAFGVLIVFGGLSAGSPFGFMIVGVGVSTAAIGLLQVAAEQILRATTDMADYARQSLVLQIALAEGRAEVDLRPQQIGQTREQSIVAPKESAAETPNRASATNESDLSEGLSKEALAALRRAAERGYEIRLSSDKRSVIVASGSWQATFSSEADIIKFGGDLR